MSPSKITLIAAGIALGLSGSAMAAGTPYGGSGMGKALHTDVENGAMSRDAAKKPSAGSGMAKALGSNVEDQSGGRQAAATPYAGSGMGKALHTEVE